MTDQEFLEQMKRDRENREPDPIVTADRRWAIRLVDKIKTQHPDYSQAEISFVAACRIHKREYVTEAEEEYFKMVLDGYYQPSLNYSTSIFKACNHE